MTSKPLRHRPRSYTNVFFARCGVKRDLNNDVVLSNRGITCPKCNELQDQYRAKAKADLQALEENPRKGPLRQKPVRSDSKRKKYFLP